jgi:hypothetical protein
VVAGILYAPHGPAKVEGVKMVEAGVRVRLLRCQVNFLL